MTVLPSTDNTVSHAVQAESANMQNIMKESHESLPASPAEALQTAATPITPPTPVTTEATEQSARQKMVAILKRSADRGLFTIPLSTGHERTLYAFLDPTCAVCKSMEPAIEQLAQNYNVVIFPVSVVNDGGDAVDKIVPVLCEKDLTARALAWSDLFRPDAGMQVPGQATSQQVSSDCSVSAQAVVAVNDTGFRAFGFSGTPTVLT
ncbi:DsbC family protein, partial [Enterobacter hormaechei]